MAVAAFPLGPLSVNTYIINDGSKACAIDAGGDPAPILDYLEQHKLELEAILLTHLHFDHIYGAADLAEATKAPVYAHEGEEAIADTESSKGGIWGMPKVKPVEWEKLAIGKNMFAGMECIVLETPGHTPGGVSYYFPAQNCVFTGDALFYRSIGRTDFPCGDHQTLLASIHEKLFVLPDDAIVYPGHGPATTIGDERKMNPFCGEFTV